MYRGHTGSSVYVRARQCGERYENEHLRRRFYDQLRTPKAL